MRRSLTRHRSGPWPTPEQVPLLSAMAGEPTDPLGPWTDIDRETRRLLPQLAPHLNRLGLEERAATQVRRAFDETWSRNHTLAAAFRPAHLALAEAGVRAMLLKGMALTTLVPGGAGLRPMEDVDVLVRAGDVPTAAAALTETGFYDLSPRGAPQMVGMHHGSTFALALDITLDLHWEPAARLMADESLWVAAEERELDGVPILVPAREDQLLHACVHGLSVGTTGPRWVADAILIIETADGGIDWETVVGRAQAHAVELQLREALDYVRLLGVEVPKDAVDELARAKPPLSERAAHRLATRWWPVPFVPVYADLWDRYRRRERRRGGRVTPGGYVSFLAERVGEPSRRGLMRRWARRARSGWARWPAS